MFARRHRSLWVLACLWLVAPGCGNTGPGASAPLEEPVIYALLADPLAVRAGDPVTLTWSVGGASEVEISLDGVALHAPFRGHLAGDGTFEHRPARTATYRLSAVKRGSDRRRSPEAHAQITVEVSPRAVYPSVTLTASRESVLAGEGVRLWWSVADAESIELNENGVSLDARLELPNGATTVHPTVNTRYVIVASGPGGQTRRAVTVEVLEAPSIVGFSASPAEIALGASCELSWHTEGATSVRILDEAGDLVSVEGQDPSAGSVRVSPTLTTAYHLSANSPVGQSQATVAVTVVQPPDIVEFESSPTEVVAGDSVVLSWLVHRAEDLRLTANGRDVPLPPASTGSGHLDVVVNETTEFRLEARGAGGTTGSALTVSGIAPVVVLDLSVMPPQVVPGDVVTLHWETSGADSISLWDADAPLEVDPLLLSGELQVSPSLSTVFTLVAEGAGGRTERMAAVVVDESVRVLLWSVEPERIDEGSAATLSWQTSGAETLSILADPGGALSMDGLEPSLGTLEVTPTQTTVYRLVAGGPTGEATGSVTLSVNAAVSIERFWAEPDSVAVGQSVTLRWLTSHASALELFDGVTVTPLDPRDDAYVVTGLDAETTFTLTAYGVGGPEMTDVVVEVP